MAGLVDQLRNAPVVNHAQPQEGWAAMLPTGRNPFGQVQPAAVVAALRATGSFDPDVLQSTKQRWLEPYRDLRRLAIGGIMVGCTLIILVSMPALGVLTFVGSGALWGFQARQVANVEAGYEEYLASARS